MTKKLNRNLLNQIKDLFDVVFECTRSKRKKDLFQNIHGLWQIFTQERSEALHRYFHGSRYLDAYTLFYGPLNAAKIALLIESLRGEGALDALLKKEKISVLDLGAGTASGLMAVAMHANIQTAYLVDKSLEPVKSGLELFSKLPYHVDKIQLLRANLAGPFHLWRPKQKVDLIVISHSLNEIKDARRGIEVRHQIIQKCLSCLNPGGMILVVEPGNRMNSQAMMRLRDEIEAEKSADILAPCIQMSTCPMLKNRGDWCHKTIQFDAPHWVQEVERVLGFDYRELSVSYLLLGERGVYAPKNRQRAVSGPLKDREGQTFQWVCGMGEMTRSFCSRASCLPRGDLVPKK